MFASTIAHRHPSTTQDRCGHDGRLGPGALTPSLCLVNGISNIAITDRAAQYHPSLGAAVSHYGTHNFIIPRNNSHRFPGPSGRLGLWVSPCCKRGHFFLIVSLETPCPLRSLIQSLDSTQTMPQPHSTLVPVCDDSTSSDSTHTAPTLTKSLDCAAKLTVSTYSSRIRRSQATCPPITVITPMPSSTTLPLPILYSWGEALTWHVASY